MKEITLKYAKPNRNGITTDYHEFLIHNVTPDGSWHLLKKEPWGFSPVIKPNGLFENENLARLVLDYIETEKGFHKDAEQTFKIAE